jgi:hypothetical protein
VRALAAGAEELLQPVCPHRPFLGCEVVDAGRNLGAVTFTDVALRRLVHSMGPCLETSCLQRLHALFTRHSATDAEPAKALAALRAEVARLRGAI